MSKFIDSLDLNKVYVDSDKYYYFNFSNFVESLKPTSTFNPVLQYFYQALEFRALNGSRNSNLPQIDEKICSYIRPDRNLFEGNKYAQLLKKVFEIKESIIISKV
jgi:hypothetical protein